MDGPVIQQARQAALDAGVTPTAILDEVPSLDVDIPLAVMTYYNLVHHPGPERFAAHLERAGICGRNPARPPIGGVRPLVRRCRCA